MKDENFEKFLKSILTPEEYKILIEISENKGNMEE